METPKTDTNKQEVCSINILFTVDTDEDAIKYKRQVNDIFSALTNVQIQFRLVNMPNNKGDINAPALS